jgi:hypothetical protein
VQKADSDQEQAKTKAALKLWLKQHAELKLVVCESLAAHELFISE